MFRLALATILLTTGATFAQEVEMPMVSDAPELGAPVFSSQGRGGPALGFTVRGGGKTRPEYFGSDDNDLSAAFGFELNYLRLGGFTFGNPDPLFEPEGFGITGSFRFIEDRDEGDGDELAGLSDVDVSVEIGPGIRYATRNFEVFGAVRYGVIGHNGIVGEIGADVRYRPTDRITLRAGPRLFLGDDDFAEEYFNVNSVEASNSAFDEFDADGGLLSAGVEIGAAYRINNRWGVDATVNYDRLTGDAEDSPISIDDDQFSASIGFTRRFTLGF